MRRSMSILFLVSFFIVAIPAFGDPDTSERDAAAAVLRVMGLERSMMAGATAMVDLQIQQNPTLAPYREVMLKWVEKYMTWDAVAPALIDLYTETFTESELKELIAFYKTPTGQKTLTELPGLMQKGAALGVEIGKTHAPELEQMIRERTEEIEKATRKPSPVSD